MYMCIYVFRVNRNTMNLSKRWLYVFVYGTLKRSEPNHCWLNRSENGFAKFLGTGSTIEKFPLVIGTRYNIPFLLDKRGIGNHVQGEVYEIDDNMLGNLDILEDYPTFYDREIQMIHMEEKDLPCWLYLIRNFPNELLMKEHLSSYANNPMQPYTERLERKEGVKASDDLNF